METFTGNAHPQETITASNKEKSLLVHCLTALRRSTALPHRAEQCARSLQLKKKWEQNGWQPTG
ncbi:Uncharacterized protein APZ42_008960 [Daphnia magna]|uniref:Uncharacterized protein n=1 Tax=Daphnia magna TaxID=35525 RepID=A0A164EAZ7_9CRUS|nr:Uncharacterized protein APZ42_008960 [Daphnia magna]